MKNTWKFGLVFLILLGLTAGDADQDCQKNGDHLAHHGYGQRIEHIGQIKMPDSRKGLPDIRRPRDDVIGQPQGVLN